MTLFCGASSLTRSATSVVARDARRRNHAARSPRRALLGLFLALLLPALLAPASHAQSSVGLGTASSFAVLGGTAVSNTGPSVISGDVGVSPGTAITGFPPGTINNGAIHANDAVAAQAQKDLTTAYNDAAGRTSDATINGDLGGRTLKPGVYTSGSSLGLTGDLTLDAQGNPDAVFIFQAGSTLTTASASRVLLIGGAQACHVFWKVGSSATLGTNSTFVGSVLALTSISATTRATIDGRLLARNGAVTLDTNTVTRRGCATAAGGETGGDETGGDETGGDETGGDGTGGGTTGGGDTTGSGGGETSEGGRRAPGRARLTGPSKPVKRPFYVRVRGKKIAQVRFFLDGRPVGRVRAKPGRTVFALLIRPAGQRYGTHRVRARVRFTKASGQAARTLRFVYQRARAPAAPRFTG